MFTRQLGRSNIEVSAIGLGCWTIGGRIWSNGQPAGWKPCDDSESVRAIYRALDLGVTFFDTADVYGCGHSERLLGKVLAGRRNKIVVSSKFGIVFDEQKREMFGEDTSAEYVRRACEASLRRLNIDTIDLYFFHISKCDLSRASEVRDALEELVCEGKIRWYGWSTDDLDAARVFARGEHCAAIQQRLNVMAGNLELLAFCEQSNLASVNRTPLIKGLLAGRFTSESQIPPDDVRRRWNLKDGTEAEWLGKFRKIRDILTANGRTSAQGALAWLWARSNKTIPIPGFSTVQQVEENVGAANFGPLAEEQMREINSLLAG